MGSLSIAPADLSSPEFRLWFRSITPARFPSLPYQDVKDSDASLLIRFPEPWFHRAIEDEFDCALYPAHAALHGGRTCTGRELISSRFALIIVIAFLTCSVGLEGAARGGAGRRPGATRPPPWTRPSSPSTPPTGRSAPSLTAPAPTSSAGTARPSSAASSAVPLHPYLTSSEMMTDAVHRDGSKSQDRHSQSPPQAE